MRVILLLIGFHSAALAGWNPQCPKKCQHFVVEQNAHLFCEQFETYDANTKKMIGHCYTGCCDMTDKMGLKVEDRYSEYEGDYWAPGHNFKRLSILSHKGKKVGSISFKADGSISKVSGKIPDGTASLFSSKVYAKAKVYEISFKNGKVNGRATYYLNTTYAMQAPGDYVHFKNNKLHGRAVRFDEVGAAVVGQWKFKNGEVQ